MKWIRRWRVVGSSGSEYVVSLAECGSWGCSCPGWKFKRAPRPDCKHIEATRASVAKQAAPARTQAAPAVATQATSRFAGLDLDTARALPIGMTSRYLDLDIQVTA